MYSREQIALIISRVIQCCRSGEMLTSEIFNEVDEYINSLPSPPSVPLSNKEDIDVEDIKNKFETLSGYLKEWMRGGKIPNELEAVVKECDEFINAIK